MRVGVFSESYQPLINGVTTSVNTLVAELERAGHSVYIFTSRFPNYTDEREGVYRFPSINSMVEPDYVLPIPISPSIQSSIARLKLDIVHSQSPFLLGVLAGRVARRYGIPHVSTNHTLYSEYTHYVPVAPKAWTGAVLSRWMQWFYNSCDQVIAPSEMTKRVLLTEYHVERPITVVPTGIPEPPYVLASEEETRRSLGVPPEARVLLYVGRLAPEKNLPMLLDAFARIAEREPSAVLVLAGSGKSAESLRAHTHTLGLSDRVIFTGFLSRTKLDPLYLLAEVFVFPSKTETQGLAIGEALAAGTPCVIVNAGGAPESIHDGDDGFLVEDNAEEMADRVLSLLANDLLRKQMSERGRVNARELRPERVAQRIIQVYENLLGTPRTPTEEDETREETL
ncbi:MAG: 1,2-diacylglycerol 3-glucosyltransferase [Capsulimonas sp.]|nr:1,2-diacylglycerol 3-glucosyltransferase [Capsulimonas sp.]